MHQVPAAEYLSSKAVRGLDLPGLEAEDEWPMEIARASSVIDCTPSHCFTGGSSDLFNEFELVVEEASDHGAQLVFLTGITADEEIGAIERLRMMPKDPRQRIIAIPKVRALQWERCPRKNEPEQPAELNPARRDPMPMPCKAGQADRTINIPSTVSGNHIRKVTNPLPPRFGTVDLRGLSAYDLRGQDLYAIMNKINSPFIVNDNTNNPRPQSSGLVRARGDATRVRVRKVRSRRRHGRIYFNRYLRRESNPYRLLVALGRRIRRYIN
ncbi:hypothetical protein QAD02_002503 [Eretmocerus hayati]|uniref:Uncharacterized protein n=1 Tax=Eretmocerus hayati TaxID=131215 RepID=A0ACC2NJ15_9HYME|nr:hypothetical protein QAD02_002503 [Eretmocerus hayati]